MGYECYDNRGALSRRNFCDGEYNDKDMKTMCEKQFCPICCKSKVEKTGEVSCINKCNMLFLVDNSIEIEKIKKVCFINNGSDSVLN